MQLTIALVTAVATALIGGWASYVALGAKIRGELQAEYDKDLRNRRMEAYSALWALTEPLALYSPPEALTPDGARALSERLRAWYFRDGIVLSSAARDAYFALQKKLTAEPVAGAAAPFAPLDPSDLETLRRASSAMRTILAGDVASRSPLMMAGDDRDR